jgi:hypothetical protein
LDGVSSHQDWSRPSLIPSAAQFQQVAAGSRLEML